MAVRCEDGAEGVFVVAAGDRDLGDGFKHIGAAVAVSVFEAGELGALGDVVAFARGGCGDDAERLMEARGEEREGQFRFGREGAVDEIHFAATRGDEETLAGERKDTAGLEDDVGGNFERDAFPVFVFAGDEFVAGFGETFGGRRVVRLGERERRECGDDAARGDGRESGEKAFHGGGVTRRASRRGGLRAWILRGERKGAVGRRPCGGTVDARSRRANRGSTRGRRRPSRRRVGR